MALCWNKTMLFLFYTNSPPYVKYSIFTTLWQRPLGYHRTQVPECFNGALQWHYFCWYRPVEKGCISISIFMCIYDCTILLIAQNAWGRTKFNPKCLDSVDKNCHTLYTWCEASKESEFEGYCIWCKKSVGYASMNISQIMQHASSVKHVKFGTAATNKKQPLFSTHTTDSAPFSKSVAKDYRVSVVTVPPFRNQILSAEILLAIDTAHHDSSFASCNNKAELYQKLFPGPISNGMTIGGSKIAYMISDGIGPYFTSPLVEDVKKSGNMYTIYFYDATNASVMKQMDLLIRYWILFFCVLTYAIIYVLIHQIIFRFYLLKYSLFFQVLLY